MTDLPRTARFAFPLLSVAQAQKEVTHNEALTLIDALIQLTVEDGPLAAPPTTPDEGQCWIVGAGASGAWSGRVGTIAVSTAGGWRFVAPREAMRVIRLRDGAAMTFTGGAWVGPPTLSPPVGGGVVDSEARSALAALISLIEAHGLLISG